MEKNIFRNDPVDHFKRLIDFAHMFECMPFECEQSVLQNALVTCVCVCRIAIFVCLFVLNGVK